jgi:GntR family transcriptional regulator
MMSGVVAPTEVRRTWLRRHPSLTGVVAAELRTALETPGFAKDGRLPAEPELARQFQVSRTTIRGAIAELEEEGLVRRRQGAGTFLIADVATVRNTLNTNSGVTDLITAAGWIPGTREEHSEIRHCTEEERQLLRLSMGADVVSITRTRTADGRPVVLAKDTVPMALLDPLISLHDADARMRKGGSLYQLIEEWGLHVHHGEAELRPVEASREIAGALGITKGDLLLFLKQVDFTADGTPVLLSHEYHLADAFTIRVYRKGPG